MSKPKVFIGSSSQALPLAEAVQERLDEVADAVLWNQDVFDLNTSALETLLDAITTYDFAVFIFAADDTATMKGEDVKVTRDNVIFELGLFLGKMGRNRVFAMAPVGAPGFHIMTDLLGITLAPYNPGKQNLAAAVGPACRKIKNKIERPPSIVTEQSLLQRIADRQDVLASGMETLANAASTAYLGQFPNFFETHIIPSLKQATNDFYIACDFPTYGFFSALRVHLEFMDWLDKKKDDIQIHTLFLNQKRRLEVSRLQMPKNQAEWDQAMQNPTFTQRLKAFWDRIGDDSVNTPDKLAAELAKQHDFGVKRFREKIAKTFGEVDSPMPIYLWIADRRKAIFSIPHFGVTPTEHGFETTNLDLVQSLERLWNRYKDA